MILTPDELVALTRKQRPSAQARVLTALGIPFDPRPDGSLIVERRHFPSGNKQEVAQYAPDRITTLEWATDNVATWRLTLDEIAKTRQPYTYRAGPHVSGIYFLFQGEQLQYVGLSYSISTRLRAHYKPTIDPLLLAVWFDSYSYVEAPREALLQIESYYIQAFKPPLNYQIRNVPPFVERFRVQY